MIIVPIVPRRYCYPTRLTRKVKSKGIGRFKYQNVSGYEFIIENLDGKLVCVKNGDEFQATNKYEPEVLRGTLKFIGAVK